MREHPNKLERANVVAGFDNQDNADEAVYLLRGMGLKDSRIGYFYPIGNGKLSDLLVDYHRFAATVVWGTLGVFVGMALGYLWAEWNYPVGEVPDMAGLLATCGTCGALFLGTAGGWMGLWTSSPGPIADSPTTTPPPYIVAVDAGAFSERVKVIMRDHGGFALNSMAPAM